jgi:hypothetical protein
MFSLRALFVVVAVAALFSWALVTDTYWVASGFVGVAVILLLWSVAERRKRFWESFAIFGVGYLVAISIFDGLWQAMPTQAMLDAWFEPPPGQGMLMSSALESAKMAAVHCGFALLLGLCGGLVCEWRTKKMEQPK